MTHVDQPVLRLTPAICQAVGGKPACPRRMRFGVLHNGRPNSRSPRLCPPLAGKAEGNESIRECRPLERQNKVGGGQAPEQPERPDRRTEQNSQQHNFCELQFVAQPRPRLLRAKVGCAWQERALSSLVAPRLDRDCCFGNEIACARNDVDKHQQRADQLHSRHPH